MQRYLLLFAALCLSTISFGQSKSWTTEDSRNWSNDFNEESNWNMELFSKDMVVVDHLLAVDMPLNLTPFPTPDYDSPGNGNAPLKIEIEGKSIVGHTAFIAKTDYSSSLFENTSEAAVHYFSILVIDAEEESEDQLIATSRNHPHYLAQGSLNASSKSRIDWVAMQMANGTALAVVNGRIFDLSVGRVILAAPQKDGSMRFYQAGANALDQAQLATFLSDLAKQEEIKSFFSNPGNI